MTVAPPRGRKDPAKVAAGEKGARSRWGPPRVVRLDDLTPEQRRLVLALVDAARSSEGAQS
jgi:hypothetical protein